MILHRENQIARFPVMNNIALECKDGTFVYLSKYVYDQALLLYDRFEGDLDIIAKRVDYKCESVEAVEYFFNNAPEPLNILAPYLSKTLNVELPCDLRVLCGYLHSISLSFNFDNYTRIPAEARTAIAFSKLYLNYEASWNDILSSYITEEIDYSKRVTMLGMTEVGDSIIATAVGEDSSEPEEEEEEDPWAEFGKMLQEGLAEEEKNRKESSTVAIPVVEEVVDPVADAAVDQISDIMRRLGGAKDVK